MCDIAKVRARRLLGHANVVLRLQNGDEMLDRGAPEVTFLRYPELRRWRRCSATCTTLHNTV